MSDTPRPTTEPSPQSRRGTRWKVGTVIAVVGLVVFVVLGLIVLVGLLGDAHFVDLFPWMFGSLAVGVLGMVLAGAPSHGEIDEAEEDADPEAR